MDTIIKMLDESLDYISHELIESTLYINVISNRKTVKCPDCDYASNKVHCRYHRSFQDLPIQGKKVNIIIENRNMFCINQDCKRRTFAEKFNFLNTNAKKTNRLIEEIIRVSLTQSSISSENYLIERVAVVKKSSICNYLKKKLKD